MSASWTADEVCLEGETGFLVHTGDTATVAQRLLQLAGDAPLRERLGRRGQQFVRENFAVEQMVDNLYALYLKLAADAGVQASACAPRETG
jgi:phosphatidylinositol alpha-1,6-mannosyltransferase